MATTRVLLDTRGKNILQLLTENMVALGNISMSVADASQVGTYDGSWGEVNINYPKTEQATRLGENIEPGHEYFVREIQFTDWQRRNNFMVIPENNGDGEGVSEAEDRYAGKPTPLTKVLDTVDDYNGEYKSNPQNFMRLKGRKSLYTLLQETWGVFFSNTEGDPIYRNTAPVAGAQGIAGQTEVTNRYKSSLDYMANYYNEQGSSFVDVPNVLDFYSSAMQGFNLGQVLGDNVTIEDNVSTV
mgnify:CR=1 FL=1